jgi:hypothetical protein
MTQTATISDGAPSRSPGEPSDTAIAGTLDRLNMDGSVVVTTQFITYSAAPNMPASGVLETYSQSGTVMKLIAQTIRALLGAGTFLGIWPE